MEETYSQLGQDVWVLQQYPINNGYYVDIGFNDGIKMNNTYLLELNGWIGLGIDPIAKNYDKRPKTKIYKVPVFSQADLEIDFLVSKYNELSGIQNLINRHRDKIYRSTYEIVKLKTQTINCILTESNAPNFIQYLSLDTEGSEFDILSSINFEKYKFGCITVEHNYAQSQRTKIQNLLCRNGYKLAKEVRFDDWYILDPENNVL